MKHFLYRKRLWQGFFAGGLAALCSGCALSAHAQPDPNLDRVSSAPIPEPRSNGVRQFDNVLYSVPPGWSAAEQNGVLLLTPPGLKSWETVQLFLLPGAPLEKDPRAQFEQFQGRVLKQLGALVQGENTIREMTAPAGCRRYSTVINLYRQNYRNNLHLWTCFLIGYAAGDRFQSVMYLVEPYDYYEKFAAALGNFLLNLRFANLQAREAAQQAEKARVLVSGAEGIPALTQEMADRLTLMFEWALDSPTTDEQRAQLREWMASVWKARSVGDVQTALKMIEAQKAFEQKPEAERALIRQQLSAKLLQIVRQNPNEPSNQWLLRVYEASHKALAPGDPPLTRQMTDAWAELLCFIRNKVAGDEQLQPVPSFKETVAKDLAKEYTTYSASWHKHLAGMPLTWAAIRAEWPHLDAGGRENKKAEWRHYLQQVFPELLQWKPKPAAEENQGAHPGETYAQAMARIQRQHNDYVFMSNMMTMQHVGMMNAISNLGNSGYHYTYH